MTMATTWKFQVHFKIINSQIRSMSCILNFLEGKLHWELNYQIKTMICCSLISFTQNESSTKHSPVSHQLHIAVQFETRRICTGLISIRCKIFTNSNSCTEKCYCLTTRKHIYMHSESRLSDLLSVVKEEKCFDKNDIFEVFQCK